MHINVQSSWNLAKFLAMFFHKTENDGTIFQCSFFVCTSMAPLTSQIDHKKKCFTSTKPKLFVSGLQDFLKGLFVFN